MSEEVIHLNRIVALPGHGDELAARLAAVSEAARQEPGCLQYDWHRVVMAESAAQPVFLGWVRWRSEADFRAHLAGPNFRRFFDAEKRDPSAFGSPENTHLIRLR